MERDRSGILGWESSRREGFKVGMTSLPVRAPASGSTWEPLVWGEEDSNGVPELEELTPLQTADGWRGQGGGGWHLEVSKPWVLSLQEAVRHGLL